MGWVPAIDRATLHLGCEVDVQPSAMLRKWPPDVFLNAPPGINIWTL